MNISIEIDEPKTKEAKGKVDSLLYWFFHSFEPKANAELPSAVSHENEGRRWIFESEEALKFLVEALAKIEREELSYKFCVDNVEGADVWERSF